MSYKAVHIICDSDLEETISFLLQDAGYQGTSYEKGRLIAYCNANDYDEKATAKNVEVQQADSVANLTEKFDIIVSNIVKNINLRLLPEFVSKLNDNGRLILCGFIDEDLEQLTKAATAQGLELTEKNIDNNWLQTQFKFKK